jgi:phosphoenolpyruvate carboxylase
MQIDNVSILLHVQNNYDNWVFFQTFLSNVHHSFSKLKRIKIEKDINIDDYKRKNNWNW